ncbi:MAG: response regulator [Clostridia bacterium]|nr:response regulator [Clostridia bacterium]
MNIVICDDDNLYRNKLERMIYSVLIDKQIKSEIIVSSANPTDIIDYVDNSSVITLYLLDIYIDEQYSGIDLAKHIRQTDDTSPIIFITNYSDMLSTTYEFMQLLMSAILLDLINSESIMTIVFFLCGSFFPLVLFLSSSVFFKQMTKRIYLKQMEDKKIDSKIQDAIEKGDSNKFNILIAEKELYTKELETKVVVNRQLLAAIIPPIITAILGIVFGIGIN